jgi:ABC-2 type transport system permease protein
MSTAVLTAPAIERPGLGRLTLVELRKMTDTRSGFWLLVATALVTVAAAVIACLVHDADSTLVNFTAVAMTPPSLLMPVAGSCS